MRDHPLRQIVHAGDDGSRRRAGVHIFLRQRFQLAGERIVRDRHVLALQQRFDVGEGVGHAERREDAVAHEIVPALAGDRRDELPGRDVEQVVVGVGAAETGGRLDEAQALDDFVAAEVAGRKEHQVAGAQAEPAAVRQQVADRHLAGDVRVVHLEGGHVLGDRVVPADLAFVHQHGERGAGERLGIGRDAE